MVAVSRRGAPMAFPLFIFPFEWLDGTVPREIRSHHFFYQAYLFSAELTQATNFFQVNRYYEPIFELTIVMLLFSPAFYNLVNLFLPRLHDFSRII